MILQVVIIPLFWRHDWKVQSSPQPLWSLAMIFSSLLLLCHKKEILKMLFSSVLVLHTHAHIMITIIIIFSPNSLHAINSTSPKNENFLKVSIQFPRENINTARASEKLQTTKWNKGHGNTTQGRMFTGMNQTSVNC